MRMQSYVFLSLAMIVAGSAVVAGKLMIAALPVFFAAELGICISLLFLLPLAYARRQGQVRLDSRTHCILLAQALCGVVLYRVFIFWGLRYTSAAVGGLLSSAAPVFIAMMAFFLLRETMPVRRILGVVCVFVGIVVVNCFPLLNDSAQAVHVLKGNSLVLAAVFCESLFSILSKPRCRPMSALFRTTMISLYAFVCLLPFALYDVAHYDCTITRTAFFCVGYYGVFVSFLSYIFWFKGISGVQAGVAASFTGLVPITAIALSACVLHEDITGMHIAGLMCILAGIYLSCVCEERR